MNIGKRSNIISLRTGKISGGFTAWFYKKSNTLVQWESPEKDCNNMELKVGASDIQYLCKHYIGGKFLGWRTE